MTDFYLILFGLGFIGLAFYCYKIARRYDATNILMSVVMILSFVVGLSLLAVPLFGG